MVSGAPRPDDALAQDSVKQQGLPEKEPAVFAVRWVQATDEKKAGELLGEQRDLLWNSSMDPYLP